MTQRGKMPLLQADDYCKNSIPATIFTTSSGHVAFFADLADPITTSAADKSR